MVFSLPPGVFLLLVAALVTSRASLPKPFELSFSDDPQKSCNHPEFTQAKKIMYSNVSLCFEDLEEATENPLNWRVMFTSFELENGTALVTLELKVRRVLIFAPGASFTMAGGKPVSVFSRLGELEIRTHYNGYGNVSDPASSSIVFKGQLNATVFEGQIIYQNLSRSHTIRCFHNNSLQPDFYQEDECLACILATFDTRHSPSSTVDWRYDNNPLCNNSFNEHNGPDRSQTQPVVDLENMNGGGFGFPQTGFFEYYRNAPDHYASKTKSTASASLAGDTKESHLKKTTSIPVTVTQNKTARRETARESFSNVEIKRNTSDDKHINGTRIIRDKDGIPTVETVSSFHEVNSVSDLISANARKYERNRRSTLENGVSKQGTQNTRAFGSETEAQGRGKQEVYLFLRRISKAANNKGKTLGSLIKSPNTFPSVKKYNPPKSLDVMSPSKLHIPNYETGDKEMQVMFGKNQFASGTFLKTLRSAEQEASRFPHFTNQKPRSSRQPGTAEQKYAKLRRHRKRGIKGAKRTRSPNFPGATRSATDHQPQPSSNQSFTETISCPLHLVADHLFFNEMGEKSPAKTVNLMLSVIIGADAVFRATDFDGNGMRDNIGFMVKNITIIHNSSTAFYEYSRTNGNSFQYLKSFSTGDFSDVCLGVAFTAIDFQRGVVGLAWYASSAGRSAGGICGQTVYLSNEGSSFSFNTAIVSFLNHGSSVSMEKAILTMAHEFGHCFGSSHDDMAGSPCNKEYPQGAYLMQRYRPSQYFPNNYKFSPCSLRQMYPVIALKGGCLTHYTGPTCGNGVVEEGEECDCGMSGTCQFNDPCCTPGDVPSSSVDPPCTVRRSMGLECSPVTFSCCSDSCKHISMAERYVCREAGDCYSQASCDGQGPLCPVSTFHPDGTPCHGGIRACTQGRCHQSLCQQAGLRDCFCQDKPDDRCKLCCQQAQGDALCRPADEFNITTSFGHAIYLPEGDGCLNYRGICTKGISRDKTFCVTVDGLDGEFSALIGLPSERKARGVTRLYNWFYLVLIPIIPAVLAVTFVGGRGLCARFRIKLKGRQSDYPSSKLSALITAAQCQSEVFCQEVETASALCDKMCSHLAFQHQRQLELQQQQQRRIKRPIRIMDQHFVKNNIQRRKERVRNKYRATTANSSPWHNNARFWSTRKAGFDDQRDRLHLTRIRSLSDSPSPQSSDLSLPSHSKLQRPCKRVPSPWLQRYGQYFINDADGVSVKKTEYGPRHLRAQRPSRRGLRATYSKPGIRTPLRGRKHLPIQTSFKRATMTSPINKAKARYVVGRPHYSVGNSHVLSDFRKSGQEVFRHGPVHNPLSSASSESN